MKKFLILFALVGFTFTATAQETTTYPVKENSVETNGFWDNWSLDLGLDYMANYSAQEYGVGFSANPFDPFRTNFGISLSATKWATPWLGVRLKTQFAWGKAVICDQNPCNPLYNQLVIGLQPMLNLHNLFAGYKPRTWNAIAYVGVAYQRNFTYDSNSPVFQFGWLNTIEVAKRWHINVELWAQFGDNNMDGYSSLCKEHPVQPDNDNATPGFQTRDWQVGLTLGFGIDFGKKGWNKPGDVDAIMAMNKAQVDALNATISEHEVENARLKDLLAKKPKELPGKVIKELLVTRASVFFNLNKSKIASRKDLVNVKELVECAKANNKTILVTGYADSKTGSAAYNQALSEARANTVAAEIVKMGFDNSKIEIAAKGGVMDLEPYDYNRRVIVTLK